MSSAAIKLEVLYKMKKVFKYFKGRDCGEWNFCELKKDAKYGKLTFANGASSVFLRE